MARHLVAAVAVGSSLAAGDHVAAQSGAAAAEIGHDGKRFVIRDSSGNSLNVGGRVQFRYTFITRDADEDGPPLSRNDIATGFEMRRTWIEFRGATADGLLEYRITGGFNRSDGDLHLEYGYGQAKLTDEIKVRWGRDRTPLLREELVSSALQLAVDRTAVSTVLGARSTEGICLLGTHDRLRWIASANDGARAADSPFFAAREADIGLTGRAELRLGSASWKQYDDFSSWRGNETGLMLGGAVHWESRGETAAYGMPGTTTQIPTTDSDRLIWTLDASFETNGWHFFGAFVARHTDAAEDFTDLGVVVHGGVFVTDHVELFGRWDALLPDDDRGPASEDFHTVAGGFNYYPIPESHAVKLTGDVQWFLDDPMSSSSILSTPASSNSLLPSSEDDQIALRLQVQLLF